MFESRWDFKPVRAGIFVEKEMKKSQAPSGAEYAAPTGLYLFWNWFYKDVAPTALGIALENSPAIYGWVKRPMNFSSPVRDGSVVSM